MDRTLEILCFRKIHLASIIFIIGLMSASNASFAFGFGFLKKDHTTEKQSEMPEKRIDAKEKHQEELNKLRLAVKRLEEEQELLMGQCNKYTTLLGKIYTEFQKMTRERDRLQQANDSDGKALKEQASYISESLRRLDGLRGYIQPGGSELVDAFKNVLLDARAHCEAALNKTHPTMLEPTATDVTSTNAAQKSESN